MSVRENNIDQVHGLLIMFMVFGHIINTHDGGSAGYLQRILFFFMQWFFFHSGTYFNSSNYSAKKDIKNLIKPFFLYSMFGVIINFIISLIEERNILLEIRLTFDELVNYGWIRGNGPLWFLPSLFCVRYIAYLCKSLLSFTFALVLFSIAYILNEIGFFTPTYFANIVTGLTFFTLGYCLKSLQYNKKMVIISSVLYFLIILFYPSQIHVHNNVLLMGNYLLCGISALAGIIFFNNVFKFFNISYLSFIGTNALVIYGVHKPIIDMCNTCLGRYMVNNNLIQLYTLVTTFFLLTSYLIAKKYLSRHLQEKNL